MKNVLIIAVLVMVLNVIGCEQVDKAFEAVDKAQKLKTEMEKKASEVKKDITDKAEELNQQVRKETGIPEKPSPDNKKGAGKGDGSSREDKKAERDHEQDKD